MRHNKTFGKNGGNHTPFHGVHLANSGEIVNELNAPICCIDIDGVPPIIREGNADMLLRVLNGYDALLQVAQAARAIADDLRTRYSPVSAEAKTALTKTLSDLQRFEDI
jgi:hypothetical protein